MTAEALAGPAGLADADRLCAHCGLNAGPRAMLRRIDGDDCAFCCYGCCISYQVKRGRGEESEAAWLLIRLGVGGFLSMNIMLLSLLLYTDAFTGPDAAVKPWIHLVLLAFAIPTVAILGGPYYRETFHDARRGRLSASALIVVGVTAAFVFSTLAVWNGDDHIYFDTCGMVLMLFTLGRYLEAAGRARAARDLEPLLQAESELATVLEHGVESQRPVRDIAAGALVRVLPGARIPVDGTVVEGQSMADEAVLTGESRPVEKAVGMAVLAGSLNLDGPLLVRTSGAGGDSRWARICASVREALSRRGAIQRIADRVVALAVPLVLALGIATVFGWWRVAPLDHALLAGLAVLVVACPCAVGLAAPLATSLGIGRLARHGCVVRDPGVLEALASLGAVAFDKTGTLTSGRPTLVAIESDAVDEALARAAGLERHSEHPLARAIVMAAEARGLVAHAMCDVRALPGRGVTGRPANGDREAQTAAGTAALMRDLGWPMPQALEGRAAALAASGHSLVHVGWAGRVRAVLAFDDTPLAEAPATLAALRARGLRLSLLTGDLEAAARRIGEAVGLDDIHAERTPEAKAEALAGLRRNGIAMVGDGLNDGPVLATADVGIAVGSATDLARETAGLTLPPNGLWLLPWIVDVSRAVRRTVLTNLAWAFGYNLVALTAAAAGLLQPILAAAVMAGSSLLVVLNSLRLERLADPVPPEAEAVAARGQAPDRRRNTDAATHAASVLAAPVADSAGRP